MEKNNSRRRFLKNTVFATMAAGAVPSLLKAQTVLSPDKGSCNPLTKDYYGAGPYYTPKAPVISNNMLASSNESGSRLVISGMVYDLTCAKVIPNTEFDIWQANDIGQYDNTGFNLRGKTYSNAQGFYIFETILPGKYKNTQTSYRPRHIHFKVTPPGFPMIVTQLYFQGDTDIPNDASASITSGTYDATYRIIPLQLNTSNNKLEGTWDIVINGAGITTGLDDLHSEKGMIYSAGPNPFHDELLIRYGVFTSAMVRIEVYDLQGRTVAHLEEHEMTAGKYEAIWKPEPFLVPGFYWVALKINDLQVHYLRIIKA